MAKLMFLLAVIAVLLINGKSDSEELSRLARHRHRILHHRYPQTFRHRPDEHRRRGGYRPNGNRQYQTFELPNEVRQPWAPQRRMPYNRRPIDIYGPPPANWPIRPSSGGAQPSPHDIYGPPVEMPDASYDDAREHDLRNDYEYEQYPEDMYEGLQKQKEQKQKAALEQSEQYGGEEMQQKLPKDDKIENFEIPLELLRN